MRYAAVLMFVSLLTGCSSPLAPTSAVDDRLAPALALLDAVETPLPWNGRTFKAWRQGVPFRVEPLPADFGAVWDGSAVILNANLTGYDTAGIAGLLAHELRHADGIRHDCGPTQDKRSTPWSAYAVHVWTLQALGEAAQARGNEGGFCD
jgi:hypothetical protein